MNATDILKEKGLKKSAQRISVITILQQKLVPLTEEEIKEDMGEIYDNTTTKYALNTDGENKSHVHFYCRICHAVICLKDVPVHRYQLHGNYKQEDCEVLIKGVCPACMTFDSDNETK